MLVGVVALFLMSRVLVLVEWECMQYLFCWCIAAGVRLETGKGQARNRKTLGRRESPCYKSFGNISFTNVEAPRGVAMMSILRVTSSRTKKTGDVCKVGVTGGF